MTRTAIVLSLVVLGLHGCAAAGSSRSEPVPPGHLFAGPNLNISAPSSEGWQVLESSPAGMVFGKRGQAPGETFIAQVAMFEMAATTAAEELEAWVKTAVEKDTDPGRFDVQQMSFKYSSERSYPCVRYQSVATDKAPRRPYPPLLLESEGLYCRHPLRQDAGFSAVYSHRGRNRHPGLRSEAEAFIQGVQVPPQ